MPLQNSLNLLVDLPKLVIGQALKPLRLIFRGTTANPSTQDELAALVRHALRHEIRAGYEHRFITLMFVTVENRIFCRRYTYGEPSWHSAFLADSRGQIKLDKTIVNINAHIPDDLDAIIPKVDKAYEDELARLGARFLLNGAVTARAHQSTIELSLSK